MEQDRPSSLVDSGAAYHLVYHISGPLFEGKINVSYTTK
jgi:hypothetical protein